MDPAMTFGGIVTILCTAISTLFWLYIRELQRQLAKADIEKKELAEEVKKTALKFEATSVAEQAATRQELAQLRQTNAELVAALTRKDGAR
jgi:biopolymer transport protein ExbB/TolQ